MTVASFATVLVRTTGRRPWRDRVTEVAAVRVAGGKVESEYATQVAYQVGPRRRYDEWGGLDDSESIPTFAQAEPSLREYLGSLPLIGPDARLHLAHLAYELSRLDRPGLSNPVLDLAALARLVSGEAPRRKPSLARLAEELGLPPARAGDLLSETRQAARAAARLIARLDGAAIPSFERLAAVADPDTPRPLLQPLAWSHLPEQPGVYILRDAQGQALYVGKANDLRRRVGSYLGHATAPARRLDGLAEATARVETRPTETELEAILLEARLIRELRPPYNVQRRVLQPRLFVRVGSVEARPRLAPRAGIAADGAVYLGPFRSATAALRARRLASAVFSLRARGGGGADGSYRERVQQALLFLTGERERAVAHLQAEMRRAAQAGDHAGLGRARDLLRQVLAFRVEDSALSMAPHLDTFLACDGVRALLIHAGRLVAHVTAASLEEAQAALEPTIAALSNRDAGGELDEDGYLVLRWLSTRGAGWRVARVG